MPASKVSVAIIGSNGLLSNPTPAVQLYRGERVFMPIAVVCLGPVGGAVAGKPTFGDAVPGSVLEPLQTLVVVGVSVL